MAKTCTFINLPALAQNPGYVTALKTSRYLKTLVAAYLHITSKPRVHLFRHHLKGDAVTSDNCKTKNYWCFISQRILCTRGYNTVRGYVYNNCEWPDWNAVIFFVSLIRKV